LTQPPSIEAVKLHRLAVISYQWDNDKHMTHKPGRPHFAHDRFLEGSAPEDV